MAKVRARWTLAPPSLERYNGVPASPITGEAAPGLSSGDAMATMERLVREELPRGIGFEWSGQSLPEILSGQQAPMLFAVSLVVVFLCLAALYESWPIPVAVLLVVPVGVLGALLFTSMRGLPAVVQADRDDFRGVHPRGVATGHFDGRRG
jgi:multidrug efflux pump